MLNLSDLILIRKNLEELREVPYFRPIINSYIEDLIVVTEYCVDNFSTIPDSIVRNVIYLVWQSYNHLAGSTTRNIPYEMEFLLSKAIGSWIQDNFIITTATTDSSDGFVCWNVNVLSEVVQLLPLVLSKIQNPGLIIVYVRMPQFYTKIPLYSVPMYHEAGHFVDNQFGISKRAAYEATFDTNIRNAMGFRITPFQNILKSHMAEYFSDLFASCFVGEKISEFLSHIAGNAGASDTHPSTRLRMQNVEVFLQGGNSPIIDCFQKTIEAIGKDRLTPKFTVPDLRESLRLMQTYPINDDSEAHGILISYWNEILQISNGSDANKYAKEFGLVNDLVIKSIRNYSIREKWNVTANS